MTRSDAELYCEELAALIDACERVEPSDAMLEAIETHIAECPTCRIAEMLLASSIAEMHRHDEDELSTEFRERLIEQYCAVTPSNGSKPDPSMKHENQD